MHKCRDCSTPISPQAILCGSCRAAAEVKYKAVKREKARAAYRAKRDAKRSQIQKKPPRSKPARLCATSGCANVPEGKAVYCPVCRHKRQLAHQKAYRDNVKSLNADLPPEPPTSLQWLDKFSGWAKSGISYAAYQKAEWRKGVSQ